MIAAFHGIIASSTALLSPEQVPGCVLCIRGSSIVQSDNTPVASQNDLSPLHWTMTQATGAKQPTLQTLEPDINDKSAVIYDGGDYLGNADFDSLSGATAYTVFTLFKTSAGGIVFDNSGDCAAINITGGNIYVYATTGGVVNGSCAYTGGEYSLIEVVYDGSLSGNSERLKLWINYVQQMLSFSGTVPSSIGSSTGFEVGRLYGADSNYFNGSLPELDIYNRALSPTEQAGVRAAYMSMYGSTSPIYTLETGVIDGQSWELLMPTQNFIGKGILFYHGSGADQTMFRTDAYFIQVRRLLLMAGYAVGSSNNHGASWGNNASLADSVALAALMRSDYGISDMLLWGVSMGGIGSLLELAAGTISDIVGWMGSSPATNLNYCFNHGFGSPIDAAYGGDFATNGVGHDPNLFSGSAFTGKRMRFYASPDDTVVPKANNTDLMAALVNAFATESGVVVTSGEHGAAGQLPPTDILAFIERCFA